MTRAEQLAKKLKTPKQVQEYLRDLPYNREKKGETLASAETALKRGRLHCFEAAFAAAAILEQHGYPPLVMSLESKDNLDHVIYVFKQKGRWGSIALSRDDGLHGRPPRYRSPRELAWSYYDPYVDKSGKITGYQVAHLDDTGTDWRASKRNVWKAEKYLIKLKHNKLKSSLARYKKLLKNYLAHGPIPRHRHWW
ncbi:MAG: hypothetical protein K0R10_32 [Alphaproteobacteria bacterium]|jgi:hypothetical protein|nr:hypothetical protein [Alphaproteobacteria bacterium]